MQADRRRTFLDGEVLPRRMHDPDENMVISRYEKLARPRFPYFDGVFPGLRPGAESDAGLDPKHVNGRDRK